VLGTDNEFFSEEFACPRYCRLAHIACSSMQPGGFSTVELRKIRGLVATAEAELLRKWNEFFKI